MVLLMWELDVDRPSHVLHVALDLRFLCLRKNLSLELGLLLPCQPILRFHKPGCSHKKEVL